MSGEGGRGMKEDRQPEKSGNQTERGKQNDKQTDVKSVQATEKSFS